MSKQDLLSVFIRALNKGTPHKKDLVYKIADILSIEPESVYRRLAGTVKFSLYEVGLLANAMNISLDSLLNPDSDKTPVFLDLGMNPDSISIQNLINQIEEIALYWQTINSQNICVGYIFTSLPVDFFIFHPYLCKYMYFKWGHHYIGSKEFKNYSTWEIPQGIIHAQNKYRESFNISKKLLYIWDISLIPNLVNEINYHLVLGILKPQDSELIKKDLQDFLENFEEFLKKEDRKQSLHTKPQFECYATNLSVGITSYYVISEDSYLSAINSLFFNSALYHDPKTTLKIHSWINSIKKISSLISGGCEKERITFFRRQHRWINQIGILYP